MVGQEVLLQNLREQIPCGGPDTPSVLAANREG